MYTQEEKQAITKRFNKGRKIKYTFEKCLEVLGEPQINYFLKFEKLLTNKAL